MARRLHEHQRRSPGAICFSPCQALFEVLTDIMAFIDDDFLLSTETSRQLYHEVAARQPIIDYHSHLPPEEIARDRRFDNLTDIWLEGDHYKWRAMRANGVPERQITGDASPREKYDAWAATVPATLRNPLYHWTHLELKRYFGIDQLLDASSASRIWDRAKERLSAEDFSVQGILRKFRVDVLCTTDDPTDDLAHHRAIADSGLATRVLPTFRPDKALTADRPELFNSWVDRLAAAAGRDISRLSEFVDAVSQRHDFFHQAGCRISDHGLSQCYGQDCSEQDASRLFVRVRSGTALSPDDLSRFNSYLMFLFGRLDAQRGWTKQLHLGARRNTNSKMFAACGPDAGFDSIGDWPQAAALNAYLDGLAREDALPKVIVYNLNPADNYVIATMLGNFQEADTPGKMQLGSGWWYLDQKEAIQWQLNTLSNVGLLSRFVGMLTDSRSFMSFPRHEYFRRVLCDLLGRDVQQGLLPDDNDLLGQLVKDICYANARAYLKLEQAVT